MALYLHFENKNAILFLYSIWLLLNLQMCQIILPDPIYIYIYIYIYMAKATELYFWLTLVSCNIKKKIC